MTERVQAYAKRESGESPGKIAIELIDMLARISRLCGKFAMSCATNEV